MNINIINKPFFNNKYIPIYKFVEEYKKSANIPVYLAIENKTNISGIEVLVCGFEEIDFTYIDIVLETLLCQRGGFCIHVYGSKKVFNHVQNVFCQKGKFSDLCKLMEIVYKKSFCVLFGSYEEKPKTPDEILTIEFNKKNCIVAQISAEKKKIACVSNGNITYTNEAIWNPEVNCNIEYHIDNLKNFFEEGAKKLAQVDYLLIASSGIIIDNKIAFSSIYSNINNGDVSNLYKISTKNINYKDLTLVNDCDVAALAASHIFYKKPILAIKLGEGLGVGYIDMNGNILNWINELAYIHTDLSQFTSKKSLPLNTGCGFSTFSIKGVLKLAESVGLRLKGETSEEKFTFLQECMLNYNEKALAIFSDLGCYLGHMIPYFIGMYNIENLVLYGSLIEQPCGEIITIKAQRVIKEEYPNININITTPKKEEFSNIIFKTLASFV